MTTDEVREKYLKFFKAAPRDHKEISPASLVPENNSTLFTPFGMQQLVPYLMGKKHPKGTRLVNSQPSIRLDDIEEVGDNRHTTSFEMLGNWSLGDYFKKDQLRWLFKFLTDKEEGLGLDPNRLYVTVFDGDENFKVCKNGRYQPLTPDVESISLWKEIFREVGIDAKEGERIRTYPAKKNWWSASGTPKQMPVGEIGGPDSEIFYDFGENLGIHEKSSFKNDPCHTNCDCGRFFEIGNSVFMQYKKINETTFEELPNKNVDFGGGLERMVAATNNDPDIFKIDVFKNIIQEIEKVSDKKYEGNEVPMRIIADHFRASCFILSAGVTPDNKKHGYVLRRLVRRAGVKIRELGTTLSPKTIHDLQPLFEKIVKSYPTHFHQNDFVRIGSDVGSELDSFARTMDKGIIELDKAKPKLKEIISKISPGSPFYKMGEPASKIAFNLYQSYGLPIDIFWEEFEKEFMITYAHGEKDRMCKEFKALIETEFEYKLKQHSEKSRSASSGMFKGGLADHSEEVTKLHTATHLLHASLRKVLGDHISQKGSNITKDRLRFDFAHKEKLTDEEIKKVEDLINEQIENDLPVTFETKTFDEAKKEGALAFFEGKYGEKVKVYSVGDFSKEVCAGPHVAHTSEIGRVRISKQEKIGSGLMRIYAVIET